jgi:uncharacterized protein (TIGR02284 family)
MANDNYNNAALQDLFKLILERKEGYQKASEYVEDDELSELFDGYVKQCEDFALELAPYNEKIERNILAQANSASSKKIWSDMKSALTSGDPKGILDSCVTGEETILTRYSEIIEEENFPEDLYNIIDQQREKIEEAFEAIKIQLNTI